jgi:aconitate hydratase
MSQYKKSLSIGTNKYDYFDLNDAAKDIGINLSNLPFSTRVLFENLIRNEDGKIVTKQDLYAIAKKYNSNDSSEHEIAFFPARVLMQDFTGVPAVVDLATMRDAVVACGGDANKVNPKIPVDLVIDHSVQVDKYGTNDAFKDNTDIEFERNKERYEFLKWGQHSLSNFRVVPPGTGICHQVNLEYLAQVVFLNGNLAYPDTLVGTDSHTTMVNALGVLGWGVGGIEAEAAMLGESISMLLPEVVGVELVNSLPEGVTATDLVLTVTQKLRKLGVVGKFVEFFGDGLKNLSLADRATISNMAPEYGATCGFFPVDAEVIKYLNLTGREPERLKLCEEYTRKQQLWYDDSINHKTIKYDQKITIDLSDIRVSLAGPKRPQDRVILGDIPQNFSDNLDSLNKNPNNINQEFQGDRNIKLKNGSVVIAAITSCTNTSNPYAMIAAGILAKKAVEIGLQTKPWVKTSFAPGSQVVTEYIAAAGLQTYLDALGFNLVGYGCTTCIGNSGPLKSEVDNLISTNQLVTASVLSGNRNFEGRVHPLVRANYLASPLLCVAYAIAGDITINLDKEPLGMTKDGREIFLKDIMPTSSEVNSAINKFINRDMFINKYKTVFDGDENWRKLGSSKSMVYNWDYNSTYIRKAPYFEDFIDRKNISRLQDIKNAKILAIFGDSITTDHISPAGNIAKNSPAAQYLTEHGIQTGDFNSYGARRGNHEVMMRGTFANIRIKNKITPEVEGGYTKHSENIMSIYDAAEAYQKDGTPLVIFAGKEYGTGSSRDWAAKGTYLLGVKAVIAESFERIHRSNLIGMGVIPLQLQETVDSLNLTGNETVEIIGLSSNISPKQKIQCKIRDRVFEVIARIDTEREIEYLKQGGIMQYVIGKNT